MDQFIEHCLSGNWTMENESDSRVINFWFKKHTQINRVCLIMACGYSGCE